MTARGGDSTESPSGSPQLSWSDAPQMSPSPSHLATPKRDAENHSGAPSGGMVSGGESSEATYRGMAEGHGESSSLLPEGATVSEPVPAPPPDEMANAEAVDQVRKLHLLVTRLHALVTKLQADNRRLRVDRDKARKKTAAARAETARITSTAMAAAASRDEEARPRSLAPESSGPDPGPPDPNPDPDHAP